MILLLALLPWVSIQAQESPYDPLRTESSAGESLELVVHDETRDRDIPIRVVLPDQTSAQAVILFSHGLGGSRQGGRYLSDHWSARGYVAVFLQHPGSDGAVWRDVPRRERRAAMERAASLENLILRMGDVRAVLDRLAIWNDEEAHPLRARLDLDHIGMSGHSFGAVTTQAVGGQSAPPIGRRGSAGQGEGLMSQDPRIDAALMMSPKSPSWGEPEQAFSSVRIPWLLMTGTEDHSPIGRTTLESRLAVYPALPESVDKFELVLHDAEHLAFSDRPTTNDRRNPNHHRAVLALSTAFWDVYLRQDPRAREWLRGDGARSILEESDRWRWHEAD